MYVLWMYACVYVRIMYVFIIYVCIMYVFMYVCMYVCIMYVCMYVCTMYVCMYRSPASETPQPSYMDSGPPLAGSGLGDIIFSPFPIRPGTADRLKRLYTKLGRRTLSCGVIGVSSEKICAIDR
jgi:hypothetical protein